MKRGAGRYGVVVLSGAGSTGLLIWHLTQGEMPASMLMAAVGMIVVGGALQAVVNVVGTFVPDQSEHRLALVELITKHLTERRRDRAKERRRNQARRDLRRAHRRGRKLQDERPGNARRAAQTTKSGSTSPAAGEPAVPEQRGTMRTQGAPARD